MSEWIDFGVYAVQALVLWVMMPRWGARFTRTTLTDRNPEWTAAHPELVARLERGGWWLKTVQAWGLISTAVLLGYRLGLLPVPPPSLRVHTPLWEILMGTSNVLMTVGFLIFGYGIWAYFRWQKQNVPLTDRRQASLAPRSTADHLPRWLQWLTYGLLLAGLTLRLVLGLKHPGRIHNVWGGFILGLIMTVFLGLAAALSVARPSNYMDRMLGPSYRHMEVRMVYGLMLWLFLTGLIGLYLNWHGVDSRRAGSLLVALFVVATIAGSALLLPGPPRNPPARGNAVRAADAATLRSPSVMVLLVPLLLPVALAVIRDA